MSAIEDLEAKVRRLRDQLRDAEDKLGRAKIDAHPYRAGDIVTERGEEFRVSGVWVGRFGRVRMTGNPRKKDGEWSKADRRLHNPKPVEES